MKWKKIEMIARRMWRGEKMELKKEDGLYDTKGLVWWKSGEKRREDGVEEDGDGWGDTKVLVW